MNSDRKTGADWRVFLGALLEMILIVANIGSAVVLFPILKRQNETAALGYVTARIVGTPSEEQARWRKVARHEGKGAAT